MRANITSRRTNDWRELVPKSISVSDVFPQLTTKLTLPPFPLPFEKSYLIDFGDIKRVTRALCKELNERFLCPTRSDVIRIESDDFSTTLSCEDGARFVFPTGDCAMLPIVHRYERGRK